MGKTMRKTFAILAICFVAFLLFGCVEKPKEEKISEEAARSFVNDDLKAKFPEAEVREIIELSPSDGSWYVKSRVTHNFSSRCPVRMHVYYDYPKKGFMISDPEYITKECVVCATGQVCVIGTPEEAIIASHTLTNSEKVNLYLTRHSDAKPIVNFYDEYLDPTTDTKYDNVWFVKWDSGLTNYAVYSVISNKGDIIKSWEETK